MAEEFQVIRFQKGLMVTNEQKLSTVNTQYINIFKSVNDLFESYILPIQKNKIKKNNLQNYNEYSLNKKNKLFLDIDLKAEDLCHQEFKDYVLEKKINTDGFYPIEIDLLKLLLNEFITFISKRKSLTFTFVNKKNISVLTYDIFKTNKSYLHDMLKDITITRNTNIDKISFHVFFNNIIYPKSKSSEIKDIIKNFTLVSRNPLAKAIDTQPYKENTLLRFIYSFKNENDNNYHYPIKCSFNKNILEIEDELVDLDENLLCNYLYTYIDPRKINYEMATKLKQKDEVSFVIKEGVTINTTRIFKAPDMDNLSMVQVLTCLIRNRNLALLLHGEGFLNHSMFTNELVKDFKGEILLKFDYEKTNCMFCKKSSHKNDHQISINEFGIILSKKGRAASCKTFAVDIPELSEFAICKWVFQKDVVKRLKNGDLIVFSDDYGWEALPQSDFSGLKYILKKYIKHFKFSDHATIEKMKEISIKEHFKTLSKEIPTVDIGYHNYFKFKNGVLNIETNEFYQMKDSKQFIVLNGVDYDYKDPINYNDEEKAKDKYLREAIDQIMPTHIKGVENTNRAVFEQNVSTCILTVPKDVITVFRGETSAGKSTIKHLICLTVGHNNFLELPISTYTHEGLNPNKPNPWLGKISYKLASFASEPSFKDKINSQTVKLMTEVKIQARVLNSNNQEQTNCLSQFIDTNPELIFDRDDPATLRRWAVVYFQTSFKSDKNQNLLSVVERQSYASRESFKNEIIEGKYSLIFFNILKEWCNKYNQFTNFGMKNTAEFADYSLFLEYFSKCLVNSVLIKNTGYIKESCSDEYRLQLLRFNNKHTGEYVVCDYNQIFRKLTNVIKNKNWKVDIAEFLKQIQLKIKNRSVFTYIFLADIKPEYQKAVIDEYNLTNKDKPNPEMSLDYYEMNKELTYELEDDNPVNEFV